MAAKSLEPETSNKPEDTAFKQQRLKAWQPILTPRWVIGSFILIGIIFVPIGIALKVQSDGLFEQTITYDGATVTTGVSTTACSITTANQGYNRLMLGNQTNFCDVTFTMAQDTSAPLYLYYEVNNFYQNHRRYVKSRSDPQCAGKAPSNASLQTTCDPYASFMSPRQTIYYPCGLIATSFFNEGYRLISVNGQNAKTAGYVLDDTDIAWSTDFNSKFQNPTDQLNLWTWYQYVWQTYDQMSCRDNVTEAIVPCQRWGDLVPGAYGQGCAACPPGSFPQSEGGVPPPGGWTGYNYTTGFVGKANALYGLRDQHFLVWMRSAALPNFRKLWGQLKPPTGGKWNKGDTITIRIVPNFEVLSFYGSKSLVVSMASPMGGKSSVLGIAYLVVGSLALAMALAFFIKHTVAPRKLGDTQYIVWRRAADDGGVAQ